MPPNVHSGLVISEPYIAYADATHRDADHTSLVIDCAVPSCDGAMTELKIIEGVGLNQVILITGSLLRSLASRRKSIAGAKTTSELVCCMLNEYAEVNPIRDIDNMNSMPHIDVMLHHLSDLALDLRLVKEADLIF